MAKDINIHVKAKDTDRTRQQLDDVGRSAKDVGTKVAEGGKKGAAGMDKLSGSAASAQGKFSNFTKKLASWAAGMVGITAIIAGVTRAIRAQIEAMKEHARIASEQQKRLVELQFLGEFFKERPELHKEVAAYAEYGRRPFIEVAEAWYNLRSKGAGITEAQQGAIMREALELGRTAPSAPLTTLVDMFSLYAKQTGVKDARVIQNILQQTITEAGGGMGDVAKYMPQFLPIGLKAGMTGAQVAGLWAYATTQFAEPSTTTAGLRNVVLSLQGRGTPESQKMLAGLGVTPQMGFFDKINALSAMQRRGGFSLAQAETLVGKESAAVLLSLLTAPDVMAGTIGRVEAAGAGRRDITSEMINALMSKDELARLEEKGRGLDVIIENIKGGDIGALRWDVTLKEYERRMREAGVPEYLIGLQLAKYRFAGGVGYTPEEAGSLMQFLRYATPMGISLSQPVIINDSSVNYYPKVGDPTERQRTFEPGVVP